MSGPWDDPFLRQRLRHLEDLTLRETAGKYERLMLLSGDASVLFTKNGGRDAISLSAGEVAAWSGRVYLASHNHRRSLSFTVGDVRAAIALDVSEIDAFSATLRFRLRRSTSPWPTDEATLQALGEIEPAIRRVIEPQLSAQSVTPATALALHRHLRWSQFARRFGVDYLVEDR